jgi:uncharacterized membrane protein
MRRPGGADDPYNVTWEFGRGRSLASASDISPHWTVAFQKWEYYI